MSRFKELLEKHLALVEAGMYDEALNLGFEGLNPDERTELIDRVLERLAARRESIKNEIASIEREISELEKEIDFFEIYNKAESVLERGSIPALREVKVV